MKGIEQLMRRRKLANRLSRWVALLFFVLGTFFYAIDSDVAKFLLPIRSIALFGLLISGVLYIIQFVEFRRFRDHPPIVVVTGIALSFMLAGYVYLREFASYREVEVEFTSRGTELVGTLYLPADEGVYPAAVLAQGSVKAPRRLYHVWADMLVREGIAVFSFDKRGTGDSGGEYVLHDSGNGSGLELLAADVGNAVRVTQSHPEIDPSAVGIIGVSMGGWTAPMAADALDDAAFMVMLSGPTVSVGEENYFNELMGPNDREGGLTMDSVTARVAQRQPSGFDPRGVLQRLDVPALWIFGTGDLSIPVPKSKAVLDTLIGTFERPYIYRTYANANHLLVLPDWPFDFPEGLKDNIVTFIMTSVGREDQTR